MIDFYNLHGHVVKKIRFYAGSTENALETVQFLETNRIQVDPDKPQLQYSDKREVQTLNKGVVLLFLLLDQTSLGPSFWDYAAESWVHTANHTTFSCSIEVVSHKTEERDHHYAAKSEIGIAVGSSAGFNRSVLVFIPVKGNCAWDRHDVHTRSLPKALLPNWRRSLSAPSSAKTGPQFIFKVQPPRLVTVLLPSPWSLY